MSYTIRKETANGRDYFYHNVGGKSSGSYRTKAKAEAAAKKALTGITKASNWPKRVP